jgi:hypothetical protein
MGESVDGRWPPPLKTFDVINKNKEAFLRLSATLSQWMRNLAPLVPFPSASCYECYEWSTLDSCFLISSSQQLIHKRLRGRELGGHRYFNPSHRGG